MIEDRDLPEDSGQAEAPEQPEGSAAETPAAPEEPTYEIDGKSYSASDLKTWRDSGLRQADYTRKTQELAQMRGELAPLEQWRNLIQSDPQFVAHVRGYFERGQAPGQAPGYQEEVDPNIAALRQQMMQQQAAVSQLSGYVTRQQLDATVKSLVEAYKDQGIDSAYIDTEVLPLAAKLGQFTPEGLEITLRGMLFEKAKQNAREQAEKDMKALTEKRGKATTVRSGSGGKLPAKAPDYSKMNSYEAIADYLKTAGVIDEGMIPEP